jgi:hypothetical protein
MVCVAVDPVIAYNRVYFIQSCEIRLQFSSANFKHTSGQCEHYCENSIKVRKLEYPAGVTFPINVTALLTTLTVNKLYNNMYRRGMYWSRHSSIVKTLTEMEAINN